MSQTTQTTMGSCSSVVSNDTQKQQPSLNPTKHDNDGKCDYLATDITFRGNKVLWKGHRMDRLIENACYEGHRQSVITAALEHRRASGHYNAIAKFIKIICDNNLSVRLYTTFNTACKTGHLPTVILLLHARNSSGNLLLQSPSVVNDALVLACVAEQPQIVKVLLNDARIDPSFRFCRVLRWAIHNYKSDCTVMMLQNTCGFCEHIFGLGCDSSYYAVLSKPARIVWYAKRTEDYMNLHSELVATISQQK